MSSSVSPAESPLLSGLNPQQREAVLAAEGPVLILAGAGSGKTRVITHRIAHLVKERGVGPGRLLAVTFTNKAAGEMRSRVERLLEGTTVTSWISTFHALCVRLLRREAAAASLPHDFLIYDDDDQLAAVREAMRDLNLSEKLHPPRRLLSRISAAKNLRRETVVADDDEGAGLTERVAARYGLILQRAGALDFDDLLLRAVALLQDNPAVCESYQQRFQYVLVDEYQDTNRTQYDLMRLLAGGHRNLTVVGDEDQSIYSWRGADIRNILDFEADFPGARVLRLEENYRSTQAILDAASGLVAHNRARKGKTLRAVKDAGAPVRLHRAGDEFQEAAFVVEKIAAARGRGGRAAVLFRTNAQSRLFEESLLRMGIPYLVVGGVGFYQRKEVRDVLAYLRLIQNPRDHLALRRVINVPARGIGQKTVEEIEKASAERGSTLWEGLGVVVDEDRLPARATLPLTRFRELIEGLRAEAAGLGLRALIERTLAQTGYAAALAQEDSQESQDRLENLAELLSAAADYETRESVPTLAGFLDRTSLLADADQVKDDAPVILMTLHSAKGLEFDSVFLVGMEEGLVPHTRSLQSPAALEEERRLIYVGMTRAMDQLFLTWAQSRQVFGQRRVTEPSRFLSEIPREHVESSGEAIAPAWAAPRRRFTREGEAREGPSVPPPPPDAQEMRPGVRVRHPLFGVGTIVRREGTDDDLKLTVSFAGVGAKRLVARYAGLTVE